MQSYQVRDVTRAIEQIAEIHGQLAKHDAVFRGWRSVPVALSGLVGIGAAAWQSSGSRPLEAWSFTAYWLASAVVALLVGCSEIVWHYAARASEAERRRSRHVVGQFLPALVAAAIATGALVHLSPSLVALLPGLWALLFGVGIFAARPYVPRAGAWVGLYYWMAGLVLLWHAQGVDTPSPWAVGGTFGAGQLLAAGTLYFSLERPDRLRLRDEHGDHK
jgi:hypothetical protein